MDSQEIIQEILTIELPGCGPISSPILRTPSSFLCPRSFFRDYACSLISGRGKAGSTGDESHLRTT